MRRLRGFLHRCSYCCYPYVLFRSHLFPKDLDGWHPGCCRTGLFALSVLC